MVLDHHILQAERYAAQWMLSDNACRPEQHEDFNANAQGSHNEMGRTRGKRGGKLDEDICNAGSGDEPIQKARPIRGRSCLR